MRPACSCHAMPQALQRHSSVNMEKSSALMTAGVEDTLQVNQAGRRIRPVDLLYAYIKTSMGSTSCGELIGSLTAGVIYP